LYNASVSVRGHESGWCALLIWKPWTCILWFHNPTAMHMHVIGPSKEHCGPLRTCLSIRLRPLNPKCVRPVCQARSGNLSSHTSKSPYLSCIRSVEECLVVRFFVGRFQERHHTCTKNSGLSDSISASVYWSIFRNIIAVIPQSRAQRKDSAHN